MDKEEEVVQILIVEHTIQLVESRRKRKEEKTRHTSVFAVGVQKRIYKKKYNKKANEKDQKTSVCF